MPKSDDRHLLEKSGLNKLIFDAINRVMADSGRMMKVGTIVAVTIINAPSSTKSAGYINHIPWNLQQFRS